MCLAKGFKLGCYHVAVLFMVMVLAFRHGAGLRGSIVVMMAFSFFAPRAAEKSRGRGAAAHRQVNRCHLTNETRLHAEWFHAYSNC